MLSSPATELPAQSHTNIMPAIMNVRLHPHHTSTTSHLCALSRNLFSNRATAKWMRSPLIPACFPRSTNGSFPSHTTDLSVSLHRERKMERKGNRALFGVGLRPCCPYPNIVNVSVCVCGRKTKSINRADVAWLGWAGLGCQSGLAPVLHCSHLLGSCIRSRGTRPPSSIE